MCRRGAPERLARITDDSRSAVGELRAAVGLLRRPDDGPDSRALLPSPADLDALLAGLRAGGLPVTIERTGLPRPVPSTTELTSGRRPEGGSPVHAPGPRRSRRGLRGNRV